MFIVFETIRLKTNTVVIVKDQESYNKLRNKDKYEATRIYRKDTGACLKARDGNFEPLA